MRVVIEIMFILKAIKFHLKGLYDKQDLILVVILYEIYETRHRLVSQTDIWNDNECKILYISNVIKALKLYAER